MDARVMSLIVKHWLFVTITIVSCTYLLARVRQDDSWSNYISLVSVMVALLFIYGKVTACPKCGKPAACGDLGKIGPIRFYYSKLLEKKCSRCGTQLR